MKKIIIIFLLLVVWWIFSYWYFYVVKPEQEAKTRDLKRISKIMSIRDELHQNYSDDWFLNSLEYIPTDNMDWKIINGCKIWYKYEVFDIKNDEWNIVKNWWFNFSNCMESKWYLEKAKTDWGIYPDRFEFFSWLDNKIN